MKSQPNRNYTSNDQVMTPEPLARALCAAIRPSGTILEPCAGDGAFVAALRPYGEVLTCEADTDFLAYQSRVEWIVTNPPWSQFAPFLRQAMTVADHVAFLVTVNHFWTTRRVRDVREAGFFYQRLLLIPRWPTTWPGSGFQLGCMVLGKTPQPMTVEWVELVDEEGTDGVS